MNGSGGKLSMLKAACPMPQLDFEVITLGHGSGGILTNRLLEAGVFNIFQNSYLQAREDGAILPLTAKTAFTTDSFVVSPIFFPDSNIGELAVNGTVNDLAMCGAKPRFLSLGFILEEGLGMEEFWDILLSIKMAADDAGVIVVTGDTKVVERGKGDKVFINTSGLGELNPKAMLGVPYIKKGDKIIISGEMATHGMAIMSVREGLEFETSIISDTRPLHQMTGSLLETFGSAIRLLRDPTRGGVATVLNEIARDAKLGISLEQGKIPIKSEVASACEIMGLDPLYVANEGIFLAAVDAAYAEEIVVRLNSMEAGRQAAIIGEVTDRHPSQVVLRSAIGGNRVVNMLVGEQLPRIC